jgi:gluconokinase
MGVSSSGKTTVGELIAAGLGAPFLDGDGFHPKANIEKMSAGIPLTDEDRWPWLEAMGKGLHAAAEQNGIAVGACSALRRTYRDFLTRAAGEPVVFVYLDGSFELIEARIKARRHHFMPGSLLRSQFATLEPPGPDENAFTVPIEEAPERVADAALARLGYLRPAAHGGNRSPLR